MTGESEARKGSGFVEVVDKAQCESYWSEEPMWLSSHQMGEDAIEYCNESGSLAGRVAETSTDTKGFNQPVWIRVEKRRNSWTILRRWRLINWMRKTFHPILKESPVSDNIVSKTTQWRFRGNEVHSVFVFHRNPYYSREPIREVEVILLWCLLEFLSKPRQYPHEIRAHSSTPTNTSHRHIPIPY